nr:hypothetical protein [Tanacetum cinerariifolium]
TTALLDQLGEANLRFQHTYPGDRPDRQPVHTVYGGANLFKADTCVRMGEIALRNLQTYAPNFVELARVLQLTGHEHLPTLEKDIHNLTDYLDKLPADQRRQEPAWLAYTVYNKIVQKLKTEAVEDFRIDFEDGFGNRPDAEEDATAVQAAQEVALALHRRPQGARRAHARHLFEHLARSHWRPAAGQLRGDAAQGHHPRADDHDGALLRAAGKG